MVKCIVELVLTVLLKISVSQETLLWNKQCNTLWQLRMQRLTRIRKSSFTNYFYKVMFDTSYVSLSI